MSGPGLRPDVDWTGGEPEPGLRCVLAPNPGPMTLDGTNTWVLAGDHGALVIDPGPLHERHLQDVLQHALESSGRVREIWLTHGHHDHSEGAARLAELAGVGVRALDPAHRLGSEGLADGNGIDLGRGEVRVLRTPGHTGDSLSFIFARDGVFARDDASHTRCSLLTGDTVLGRGTTVVAHPDGQLGPYLRSLTKLRTIVQSARVMDVLPGHGPILDDADQALSSYLEHRQERLGEVSAALQDGISDPDDVVARVYSAVDRTLWPAAKLSVLAQLEYLRSAR